MLNFDGVLPALERFSRRLSGQAKLRHHPIGSKNALHGQAYFLDFGAYRVLLAITGFGTEELAYSRGVYHYPQEIYESTSSSGLDMRMDLDWDHVFYGLKDQIPALRSSAPPRGFWPASIPVKQLPDSLYPLLSAAVRQRIQAWKPEQIHLSRLVGSLPTYYGPGVHFREWCPHLEPALEEPEFRERFVLDLARLELPWPAGSQGVEQDGLDFYSAYPDAHGKIYLGTPRFSVDGAQCVLAMCHSLAVSKPDLSRNRAVFPASLSAEPSEFVEYLVMERRGIEWVLTAHIPHDVSRPPALAQASEKARLQAELGDWGQVLSVEVDDETAIETRVQTPVGPRRVIGASALASSGDWDNSMVFKEPTVWIFDRTITGGAIRRAVNPGP